LRYPYRYYVPCPLGKRVANFALLYSALSSHFAIAGRSLK
jgi:hypothetical protein